MADPARYLVTTWCPSWPDGLVEEQPETMTIADTRNFIDPDLTRIRVERIADGRITDVTLDVLGCLAREMLCNRMLGDDTPVPGWVDTLIPRLPRPETAADRAARLADEAHERAVEEAA